MTPNHLHQDDDHDGGVTFAVLGHPGGDRFLRAPATHQAMLDLQGLVAISRERLYCSIRAGGCGEPLHVVNGTERRPHFRHFSGSKCELRDRDQTRDRYTHRIIQEALVVWLANQGIEARAERALDAHSRVDVYTEPGGAVIEVQLSPESASSMLAREVRYGGLVAWLFGTKTPIASRSHVLDRDGLALVVRLKPVTAPAPYGSMYFRESMPVEIAIQHTAFENGTSDLVWHPLGSCEFDPPTGRVQPPGYGVIFDLVAGARDRRKRAAEAARHPVVCDVPHLVDRAGLSTIPTRTHKGTSPAEAESWEEHRASSEAALRTARQLAHELRRSGTESAMDGPRPSILKGPDLPSWASLHRLSVPPESSPWRRTLRYHAGDYAERSAQIAAAWAVGLPAHLVDPAWGALYHTMVVHSAPLATLADTRIDPQGLIIHRLIGLGLISVHTFSGVARYEAAHDLRYVGSPLPWSQPPAWSCASSQHSPSMSA